MSESQTDPTIRLFRLISAAPDPRRADRAAGGLIPTRALRFCDPVTSASAFGWWVFPPMGFTLVWDGSVGVLWAPHGSETWYPLEAAQFPGFASDFRAVAPEDVAAFTPPFLTALIEPGLVQVFSGWIARTRPGWSTLVRRPANFPRFEGVDFFEGLIETDTWFGPLFINIRLTKTDVPIIVRDDQPLLQITPVFRDHYADALLDDVEIVASPSTWSDREWNAYRRTVVEPHRAAGRRPGAYAIAARRQRRAR